MAALNVPPSRLDKFSFLLSELQTQRSPLSNVFNSISSNSQVAGHSRPHSDAKQVSVVQGSTATRHVPVNKVPPMALMRMKQPFP